MRKFASTFATVGGLWTVLCPACIPAVAVVFSSVGLGILADFVVGRGVMLVLLALAFVALHASALTHRRILPFVIGVASGMIAIFARNIYLNQWLVYLSGVGLLTAAMLDYIFRRRAPAVTCAVSR